MFAGKAGAYPNEAPFRFLFHKEQGVVVENKSSWLLRNILQNIKTILKQKVFTKVLDLAKLGGVGGETSWSN
jgi:hypothetical protein